MVQISALTFVSWSLFCVIFTAGLVYFVMRSQMEVRLARQREQVAGARATLQAKREALEDSLKTTEETIRRKAMDEFLADIHVEERHYTREHRVLFATRKMLVRQERIFFRNIPLSSWVEHEMPFEEGVDPDKLAQTMSVFANAALFGEVPETAIRKLLR
ncbi:MAG TPA: hypothetical protein VG297_06895 [Bryobacteraceae bacterium]|jgi:hypothetical protein|nr:hypothetical protein [Bryobacteraceae bacterium]